MKEFHFQEVRSSINLQQSFDQPRRMTLPYAVGEEGDGKKGMLTMSWLFPPIVDPEIILGMHILSYILVGTPASPLRKALIDSGLGEDLTGGGLESEFKQMFFATGLKGIQIDNQNKIENLILDTLDTLVRGGIDPDTVAAAINTTEFRLRENNTGSFPRGLLLLLRSLTTWLYDRDPLALLAFEAPLQSIQAKIAASDPFFEALISRYILKNPHQTTVVLVPDPQLRAKQEMEEKERLAQVRQTLNQDDLAAIIEANRRLKSIQETPDSPEALASIPVLTLADLDRQVRRIPLKTDSYKGSQVLTHHLFTNKIRNCSAIEG